VRGGCLVPELALLLWQRWVLCAEFVAFSSRVTEERNSSLTSWYGTFYLVFECRRGTFGVVTSIHCRCLVRGWHSGPKSSRWTGEMGVASLVSGSECFHLFFFVWVQYRYRRWC